MSKVWRRLQRVGKTAYKFEFTIKVHTVTLECVSGWTPNQVSVLWVRRGRRVRTEATSWTTLPGKDTQGVVHWQALEATITLYMESNQRRQAFEDKFWTLIVENVGSNGKHKALATKRINMAEFVNTNLGIMETRKKYEMKPVASKVHVTEVQVTFISKFEKQGPATDDDMRSISSEMSELNLSQLGDGYMSEGDNDMRPNSEENEKIMQEIAAIGAGIQELTNFDTDPLSGAPKINGRGSHESELIGWVNQHTVRYPKVRITDMKDSWRDAYAFCAIIHSFRPDILDIELTDDPYTNAKLATRAAFKLGIAPTIDALDFHKGQLDKLGIVTFVDQLYQRFKDNSPTYRLVPDTQTSILPIRKLSTNSGVQTDESFAIKDNLVKEETQELMKHRLLKDSPKHKRANAHILHPQKSELSKEEEELRRKEMIERGRLRLSKRRPNARKTQMSAKSYDSVNSTNSLDESKSPNRSTVKSSPQGGRQGPGVVKSPLSAHGPMVFTTEATIHSPSVSSHRSLSVKSTTSSKLAYIDHAPEKSPRSLRSSLGRSSPETIDCVLDSLRTDKKQEDQASETGSSGIIIDSPPHTGISTELQCTSSVSLEEHPDVFIDNSVEVTCDDIGLDAEDMLKAFDQQLSSEHHIHQSSESSSSSEESECEESLDDHNQPSDIKISTIRTENDKISFDTDELKVKLSESLDETAMAKEAILMETESHNLNLSHYVPENTPQTEIQITSVPAQDTPPKTPEITSPVALGEPNLSELKIVSQAVSQETPPETPDVDDFDDQIQKEIDALEADLSSSIFLKSIAQAAKPVTEEKVLTEPQQVHKVQSEPTESEAPKLNLQPTPPVTPPVVPKRGPSLRDKIRGLHESRHKLIAATSESNVGTNRTSPALTPTSDVEKPIVPRRRLANSTSSQGSSVPSIPEVSADEKTKPPAVKPKPLDRKTSHEKIALLRAQSSSSRSSISSSGISEDPKPQEPAVKVDEGHLVTQEEMNSVECNSSEDLAELNVSLSTFVKPIMIETVNITDINITEDISASESCPPSEVKDNTANAIERAEPPTKHPTPPASPKLLVVKPSVKSPKPVQIESMAELISSFSAEPAAAVPLSTASEAMSTSHQATTLITSKRCSSPDDDLDSNILESSTESRGLLDDIAHEGYDNQGSTASGAQYYPDHRSSDSNLDRSMVHSGSSDSGLSQPPPPPPPEPLMMMMGAEVLSEEESDHEPQILQQDLQDVRDYISECHARISHHNTKLDKRAKVLEKQLREVMDAQNHELEQKLLKSWLQLVHERNTLVRKQDELNSIQNEDDLEQRCCVIVKEMRKYQNMRESTKTECDFAREEQLDEEYKEILRKREILLRIREDINTISMEEEAEFQSVLEKPKLLQDQSNCRIS